ncbi:arabinan endo-1,5-alpha-L-arabinosidase [Okibacterium sp. HSC-33S16]|uniref:family 43 glycosylhydrolase n=1 Tax=Okibacterium sp. HSC-33S16 TaxID=2910965 RepID=UPI00209C9EB5|nr:family 43 glycosylhydrolase [Okibacterium sp. HSC-33S16]MCP2031691.1 arabinan endo-1,5-alpha-L-arabinosidase [Okibacterium sp. HSC-33S16]
MRRTTLAAGVAAAVLLIGLVPAGAAGAADTGTYSNPLTLTLPSGDPSEQCADPDIIRAADPADPAWYLFCTRDALDSTETNPDGSLRFYSIPTFRSTDLVNWTFVAEALPQKPAWIGNGDMWAPDVVYLNGQYHLYYTATETVDADGENGGSAIGVATAPSPAGPWTDAGAPVVEPIIPAGSPNDRRWVYDPEVITANGQNYLYFGSYFGGLSVRELSVDGLTTDPASQVEVAISNRYEGTNVVERAGYFYLLASATNCCAGPLTGYGVFAGRSTSPTGPFLDRTGTSLLAGRVGGTPVLHQNGNRWIGTGHNTIVTDLAGTDWIVYHAVDRTDPYLVEGGTYTKRPALMDRIDWASGWPTVNGGRGPSDTPQPAPATQPDHTPAPALLPVEMPQPGDPIAALSDEFDGASLSSQWSWIREPDAATYGVADGTFRFDTQAADLSPDPGAAGLLTEPAPVGDYVVETRLSVSVPAEGCCQNYVQGGIVLYSDDGNFIKHAVSSIWETRQTEFAKRESPVPAGYPVYGNSVGGPVGEATILRIVRTHTDTENLYTGYSSLDGETWDESGTWTTPLGVTPRIGLVSMAGAGFTSTFDYVRVSSLAVEPTIPTTPPATSPPTSPATPPVTNPTPTTAAPGDATADPGAQHRTRSSLSESGANNAAILTLVGVAAVLVILGVVLLVVRRRRP